MLTISVQNHQLHIGDDLAIAFMRTIRIPDDDKTYPLGLGLR